MKLSHSAVEKYNRCPFLWKTHYNDKIRSERLSSPLIFGNAIDRALNRLLLEKKLDRTPEELEELELSPEEIFIKEFSTININGTSTEIFATDLVDYSASDCSLDLLSVQDIAGINSVARDLGIEDYAYVALANSKVKHTGKDLLLHNTTCWYSLAAKAVMLIGHYRQIILPQIHTVFGIQKQVSLKDGEHEFVGLIDAIVSFNDAPTVKYVTDNKTSSIAYKEDSVRNSAQLSAYCENEGLDRAAYIVLEKNIRKKEPRVRSQIIKDTIPESQKEKTFDKFTEVLYSIEEGKFEKNFEECFAYGRKCDYYDYCRTGSMKCLVKLEDKNGKS